MKKIIFKKLQTFNAALTALVLFASFYFQYKVGLMPCPLCLMQRVCVFLLLAVMTLSFYTIKKAHIISLWQIIISSAGLYFSLRQLWLQSLPSEQVPACVPGLEILIRYFPWQTVAKTLFWGSGECSEVSWSMLNISMPGWCAFYFSFMALMGYFLFRKTRRHHW